MVILMHVLSNVQVKKKQEIMQKFWGETSTIWQMKGLLAKECVMLDENQSWIHASRWNTWMKGLFKFIKIKYFLHFNSI